MTDELQQPPWMGQALRDLEREHYGMRERLKNVEKGVEDQKKDVADLHKALGALKTLMISNLVGLVVAMALYILSNLGKFISVAAK